MFRKMRRSLQALSHEEMIDLLKKETRGVMSVQGDDGYPYGFPRISVWIPDQSLLR